ncbi:HlyD family type I secretion periplasmic adaptor subunit [Amylibacter sp. SFDW26]|uniref:HlyD family type I secretion periplasmic adaptor subunit n=1 Tax=Amylibacter sp. SFDW26 TaxID=2652722 RepID=UPI001261DAC3|nr:HlyD family type I secretion periplasmic adaptor subunit [Amylibacter sp. SFDW26]KAB7609825.1 HlyD family type I secretion periplasmic adaptor subunit [Amylibacter sp. SFDW26]
MTSNKWSASRPLFIGFFSLVLLVLGVGLWSVTTQISGAVIASGRIQVEANKQVIQHPSGGIVGEILVSEGDIVDAGDVVVRLDDTDLKSELAIVESQYFELLARKALFQAERDDTAELTYDDELITEANQNSNIQSLMDGQSNFFTARKASLERQKEQLKEQTIQLNNQVAGVEAQNAANKSQLELLSEELTNTQSLLDKGLAQASRVLALRREDARIAGQVGSLNADLGRLKAAINGINIQLLQLDTERRTGAIESLRDIGYRTLELAERRVAIKQTLARLDVRAPMSGIVHDNQIFALQSVVQAAQPMMYIIPSDLPLVIQAQVDVVHVDQVYVGQDATLNFAAFSQRTTPQIFGKVTKLSADVFTDQVTGLNYYQVELVPHKDELDKLKNLELLPGMPVEAFLKTDDRSAFSYLVKPVTDYFNKAFREE